jgi:hypothetical protein
MNNLFPKHRFSNGKGLRGLHISLIHNDQEKYSFLPWEEALKFLRELGEDIEEPFCNQIAAYNPDKEAITFIHDSKDSKVVLALYTLPPEVTK